MTVLIQPMAKLSFFAKGRDKVRTQQDSRRLSDHRYLHDLNLSPAMCLGLLNTI